MASVLIPMEVVARYLEDQGPEDDLSWMEYMKERDEGAKQAPDTVKHMLQKMKEDGKTLQPTPSVYNPYDYNSPSDKPKDMKDSPPFSNEWPTEPPAEYGVFNVPNRYGPHGVLEQWYKARDKDWTADPSEQRPAISIDRKFASMEREAATLDDVVNRDYHYKNDQKISRATSVNVNLMDSEQDSMLKGLFRFRCQSANSKDPRTVTMQFLRPKGRLRPKSYLQYPVQFACTCPAFLFYGSQYYAVHDKYMWMPGFRPSLVPPVPQGMISSTRGGRNNPGRGLNCRVCKHVLASYEWIQGRNLRILMHYRRYPRVGPPAKVMNAKQWEKLMGFPFTLDEIKRRLSARKPSLPRFFYTNFFRTRQQSAELEQWFRETFLPRTDPEKIRVLETLVEHPEEIFYLLVKLAIEGDTPSPQLIEKAYELMSRVVQPENEETPEGPEFKKPGTRAVIPGEPKSPEKVKGQTEKADESADTESPEDEGSPSSQPNQNESL